jgi:subtilisin family serine protease
MANKRLFFIPLVLAMCLSSNPAQGVRATRAASTAPWDLSAVGAAAAWAQGADGHGVSVLVIDSGLDNAVAVHDMRGSILPSLAVNPLHEADPGVRCPDPSPYTDTTRHGTFVVSLVVAPIVGIAPRAKVAMAKASGVDAVGNACGTTRDLATAVRWGVAHRFPLISISEVTAVNDPPLHDAVAYAVQRGVIVVAAVGNGGDAWPEFPAAYPGVIAVGASNETGDPALQYTHLPFAREPRSRFPCVLLHETGRVAPTRSGDRCEAAGRWRSAAPNPGAPGAMPHARQPPSR